MIMRLVLSLLLGSFIGIFSQLTFANEAPLLSTNPIECQHEHVPAQPQVEQQWLVDQMRNTR